MTGQVAGGILPAGELVAVSLLLSQFQQVTLRPPFIPSQLAMNASKEGRGGGGRGAVG